MTAAVPALAVDPLPELAAASARRPARPARRHRGGVEADLRAGRCEVALTDGPPADRDPLCRHDAGGREIVLVTTGAEDLPDPLPRPRLAEVPLVTELGDSWLHAELGEPRTVCETDGPAGPSGAAAPATPPCSTTARKYLACRSSTTSA